MKFILAGATVGWVGSSIALIVTGMFNLGTVFVGMVIGALWLTYIAFSMASK